MRKFTLSVLVLLVSVFFLGQSALGQGMFSKTADIIKSTSPIVTATKSVEALEMADMYSIDFEAEVAWTFDFMPWTVVDVDLQPTWGIDGHTFPHSGEAMAFIVFDPATVDPSMADDPEIQPHSGAQLGVCMASIPDPGGNDDWFISDMLSLGDGANFNFWAKSYTDQYGLERFNVAVSTTTPDPAEFTVISGGTYVEAPVVWTEFNYDLSAYAGQDAYVAIQCVTNDAFIFMIDDLVIDPGAAGGLVCEDFDALTVGGQVADQLGDPWTTWSGTPGTGEDAYVSDTYSNSPDNSFVIDDGGIDLVYQLDAAPISTGMWMYSHYMYVPTGFTGYFNVQTEPVAGVGWNLDLFFLDDGTGYFGTQSTDTYTFPMDTWFMVEIMYDLDGGMGYVYFDGTMVTEFENTLTIGGIDYWGWADEGPPGAYYDDVCFGEYVAPPPCENFDALTVGGQVADQLGDPWTTWSGAPGTGEDAYVSDTYSNSPDNSFVIDDGGIDLVYQLDAAPISTGMWMYSHYMYVPTGFTGYFNVQTEPVAGVGWNLDLFFLDDGTGYFGTQSTDTYTFPMDTWFMVEIMYDLDGGMGYVYFDGAMVTSFANTLTIGGIDFWGWADEGPPGAYYDDVCFGEYVLPSDCEDFDALTVGGLVADQLGYPWSTWSGTPGSSEDAPISDMYSNSPDNSFVINDGGIDLVYQLGTEPLTTGKWLYSHYMYVPTGFTGYFNVQTEPVAGVGWNLDLYFEDGGTGYFGTQSTEAFDYPQDTWFMIEINYDLDNGYGQVLFDGVMLIEFVNEETIGGIDYWGWGDSGDPGAYYDDVCFGPGWVITGIEDEGAIAENNTTIFPNPATDRVTIRSNNIIDEVLIYNNMGQLVFSGPVNDDQIMVNTSTYVTGMYIVQVRTGTAVEVRKLIIE